MKEFLISLYDNPSFPIYLGAVILVLVIAFFVIFFLGKRDQKNIEKTQRLEQIHDNAFNETTVPVQMNVAPQVVTNEQRDKDLNNAVSETPVQNVVMPSVETPQVIEQPVVQPEPVVAPVVEQPIIEQPVVEPTPVIEQPVVAPEPVIEQPIVVPEPVVQPEPMAAPVIEQPVIEQPAVEPTPVIEQPVVAPEPVVEQPVQNNDVVFPTMNNNYDTLDQRVDNQLESLQNISNSITNEFDALQQEQEKYHSMSSEPVNEQPVVAPEPVIEQPVQPAPVQTSINTNNVFSSVYAPPRVEQPVVEQDDDEIELPRLK